MVTAPNVSCTSFLVTSRMHSRLIAIDFGDGGNRRASVTYGGPAIGHQHLHIGGRSSLLCFLTMAAPLHWGRRIFSLRL